MTPPSLSGASTANAAILTISSLHGDAAPDGAARPAEHTSNYSAAEAANNALAAIGRSAIIKKLILLPKLKAAAWFQPEDHGELLASPMLDHAFTYHRDSFVAVHTFLNPGLYIAWPAVKKSDIRARTSFAAISAKAGAVSLGAFHYGGIFAAGVLLFCGHDAALAALASLQATSFGAAEGGWGSRFGRSSSSGSVSGGGGSGSGSDSGGSGGDAQQAVLDGLAPAPAWAHGVSGGVGGALYALVAAPVAAYIRGGPAPASCRASCPAGPTLSAPLVELQAPEAAAAQVGPPSTTAAAAAPARGHHSGVLHAPAPPGASPATRNPLVQGHLSGGLPALEPVAPPRVPLTALFRHFRLCLLRDVGGFALYFGVYAGLRAALQATLVQGQLMAEAPATSVAVAASTVASGAAVAAPPATPPTTPPPPPLPATAPTLSPRAAELDWVGLAAGAGLSVLVSAGCGGCAGVAAYAWRSPWDNAYKVT